MQTIPNVTTADTYTAGCTLEDLNAVAATYVAANAAVIAQFRPKRKDGTQAPWGPELLLSPQSNSMVNVAAMRFRSAVAGVPAQIVAALYDETDALPGAATPFSQTISSSGSVTPGVSAVQIQHNGGLVGSEPTLDFVDSNGVTYTVTDDVANTRVLVAAAPALSAVLNAVPPNPAGTSSATDVMMGLGSTAKITPVRTGRLHVVITGTYTNTSPVFVGIGLRMGTGAIPANGAAPSGTSNIPDLTGYEPAGSNPIPFTLTSVSTGWVIGTQVWIDVVVSAGTGGTSTIQTPVVTAVEI